MFQADLGGVFQLRRGSPQDLRQPCRRHGAGRTHLALAAHFGAGDGRILFAQDADGSSRQQVIDDVGLADFVAELHVVMQHRRDNPRRTVGRRRDHAPAGGVFLVDRQGEQVHPLHGAEGGADDVGFVQLLQAAMQACRTTAHIEATRQDALVFETVFHAVLHGTPELHQPRTNFRFAAPDFFVGHHQLRHAQVVLLTQFQQFHGGVEIVGQHGVVGVQHAAGGLGRVHHETAAHRVVGVAVQLARLAFGNQGHGVGVVGQVLVQQQHVALPHKRDGPLVGQLQGVGVTQGGDVLGDGGGVHGIRPFAHQAHDHGVVAAVAHAGGGQRAVQAHLHACHLLQFAAFAQALHEQRGGAHGPHRMGTGRPDADLEQVKHTDSHCRAPPELGRPGRHCGHWRNCYA